jgi:hypothetical protein
LLHDIGKGFPGDHTDAGVALARRPRGGERYNPHTSWALSQKSGSWEIIELPTGHGMRSNARQIRQT